MKTKNNNKTHNKSSNHQKKIKFFLMTCLIEQFAATHEYIDTETSF